MMSEKSIFLACPIGPENSATRKWSDGVFKHLVEPVIHDVLGNDNKPERADHIGKAGRISTQILQQLVKADVVIADLTDLNSNVLYELGVRQALLKPYILIAKKGTELPFDLRDLRTIFFLLELDDIASAKIELVRHLRAALGGHIDPQDEQLFGPRRALEDSTAGSGGTEAILSALGDISAANRELKDTLLDAMASRSAGSYEYIEGEKPAFAELVAATLRAKDHVRSTRFFSSPISGRQPDYAAAIHRRVIGDMEYPCLRHYSRIIQTNNPDKLSDIESYIREFSGCPFTLYLTPHSNNFELVIIDEHEVFIHFHAKQAVIGSTLHIFGANVAGKFTDIFDRLHDPVTYPGITKFDCKYITTSAEIETAINTIRGLFRPVHDTNQAAELVAASGSPA